MGSAKRSQRIAKAPPQLRSRTTRSSKGRLLSDPAQNTQLLTEQLRSLGLYAAPTLGDGNCLFRALSDQLYGTPSKHPQLRKDICDWIASHKTRYEPFVEDERGLDVHLSCMRENATYGGHMELSAFAHLTRRNVKVIQPGLVYVIEWAAGGDADLSAQSSDEDSALNDRERRRLRRDQKRAQKERATSTDDDDDDAENQTIYVAYHDWEHFSSIRNLRGPHTDLPCVRETPPHTVPDPPPSKKAIPKVKLKLSPSSSSSTSKPVSKSSKPKSSSKLAPPTAASSLSSLSSLSSDSTSDPTQIPLPSSRSTSPSPPSSFSLPPYPSISASSNAPRTTRSPKRAFDESSASGSSSRSETIAKRTRSSLAHPSHDDDDEFPVVTAGDAMDIDEEDDIDIDADDDVDTPELSAPSSASSSSTPSSTPSPSPSSSASSSPAPVAVVERPLTRRQRKMLGLPKPRAALAMRGRESSAGKIVIPGGKYARRTGGKVVADEEGDDEEWRRNGTGRVDVRGFRELKI